jgi:predicted nucleic acid-binding protein
MKIDVALSDINILSMETAPFIYYTESRPFYVDKMRDIFRRIGKSQFTVVCSTITLSECLTKPLKESDFVLVKAYNELFETTYGLTMVSVDMEIARHAAELRAKYGLKTPDALHIATALETGCQTFLTNDMKLKQVTEIQVLVLDELEVS